MPVLIAGAGPTGLVLALWLHRLGIRFRLVDKAAEPGTASRALAVQARTLEFYDQIGLAEAAVAGGIEFAAANLWVGGKHAARAAFGAMGQGLSPHPSILILPQDEHERLLAARLAEAGITVERRTELMGFEERGEGILARLKGPDGLEETCEAAYLAGCDGARSVVRETLHAGFPGGTYAHRFYVADIEGEGPVINGELNVALDEADFLGVFPMKGEGRARLVGMVPGGGGVPGDGSVPGDVDGDGAVTFEDVSGDILRRLGIRIERVNWFSTYNVHHRVAGRFRAGRAFLLGDAAHIHSPVGAQGMNTGIGDAVNLAWKLAAVLHGRADAALLDSYEPERLAFARRLVATTDRAFSAVTSPGAVARFVRTGLVPRILPRLAASPTFRRFMFRTVSQIGIHYRAGPLSEGAAGAVRGGDRLPWVSEANNFRPLRAIAWQVHVYGEAAPALRAACGERRLPLHVFPWSKTVEGKGLKRDALYCVRPDGHVGLAHPEQDPAALARYCDARGIRPSGAAA